MPDTSHYAGVSWQENAAPVALAALEDAGLCAIALADGRVMLRLLDRPETLVKEVAAHNNGICAMRVAASGDAIYTGGEDGRVVRMDAAGDVQELTKIEKAWIENIAVHETGLVAASYKKTALIFDAEGKKLAELPDHPSTIGGLAFDPKGKRLAVSHYNGVSLWWVGGGSDQKPQRLNWKGSHLDLLFAPSGKYLLSCMQENALHGWRLPDFADFAMSGYSRKPRSFAWTQDGKWLASAGSPGMVCWDCSGKGPMGRPAVILGEDNPELTNVVACHPELDLVAAGTEKGAVYLARFQDDRIVNLKTNTPSPMVHLSWSASGQALLAASEDGHCYVWPFSE